MSKNESQPIKTTKRRRILAGCVIGCSIAIIGAGAGVGIGYAIWANGSERIVNKTVRMQSIKDNKAYNEKHILPFKIINTSGGDVKELIGSSDPNEWDQGIAINWLETKLHAYNFYNAYLQQGILLAHDFVTKVEHSMAYITTTSIHKAAPPIPKSPPPTVSFNVDDSFIHFDEIKWNARDGELSTRLSISVHLDIVGYTTEYYTWMAYQMANNPDGNFGWDGYSTYLERLTDGDNVLTLNFDVHNAWMKDLRLWIYDNVPQKKLFPGAAYDETNPGFTLSGNPASYYSASLNGVPINYYVYDSEANKTIVERWTLDFMTLRFWSIDFINVYIYGLADHDSMPTNE